MPADPSRRKFSFLYGLLHYVCLFMIIAVIVAPSHVFAGTRHDQRRAARQARHAQRHSASSVSTSSAHTETHRVQSR